MMIDHKCECKFCPIYYEATKESADFHNWIATKKPKIWVELINSYMIVKLSTQKKRQMLREK